MSEVRDLHRKVIDDVGAAIDRNTRLMLIVAPHEADTILIAAGAGIIGHVAGVWAGAYGAEVDLTGDTLILANLTVEQRLGAALMLARLMAGRPCDLGAEVRRDLAVLREAGRL